MTGAGWTTFGTGGSGVNQFDHPERIAIDSQDRIYIADRENGRVVRINDITGAGWVTFGTSGSGTNQFDGLTGIAVDANNHIYIGDWLNHRIVRIDDMTGTNWTTFGSFGSGVGQIGTPVDIKIAGGFMYIVDYGNNRIVRTNPMSTTGWTELSVGSCEGFEIDSSGRIYATTQDTSSVVRYDSMAGDGFVSYGTSGSGTGNFFNITDITLGP
jgi:streptogramin lyase